MACKTVVFVDFGCIVYRKEITMMHKNIGTPCTLYMVAVRNIYLWTESEELRLVHSHYVTNNSCLSSATTSHVAVAMRGINGTEEKSDGSFSGSQMQPCIRSIHNCK